MSSVRPPLGEVTFEWMPSRADGRSRMGLQVKISTRELPIGATVEWSDDASKDKVDDALRRLARAMAQTLAYVEGGYWDPGDGTMIKQPGPDDAERIVLRTNHWLAKVPPAPDVSTGSCVVGVLHGG